MDIWDAILIFYIFWGCYFALVTRDWFGKKFSFLKDSAFLNDDQVSGFVRTDRKTWNIYEFYLVGVFLLPIRFVVIAIFLGGSKTLCRVIQFFMKISFQEIDSGIVPRKFVKISQSILKIAI